MSRARTTFHFEVMVANILKIFFAQLSCHPNSISYTLISGSSNAKSSTYSCTFHLFSVAKSGPVRLRFILAIAWAFSWSAVDLRKVIFQVISFTHASLGSLRSWQSMLMIVLDWSSIQTVYLISSKLGSWWNICWCILLIAWQLLMLLRVECFIFMSVNISTSWIHWWSFLTSLYHFILVDWLLPWAFAILGRW